MGWEKFRNWFCPHQPEEFARSVISTYRTVWAPRIPKLWRDLERVALLAMLHPGRILPLNAGFNIGLSREPAAPFWSAACLTANVSITAGPSSVKRSRHGAQY